MIYGLPPTSALAREMHPDTVGADWGITQELIATAIELIDQGNRQFVMAHSKKGTRPPKPIKIVRPWEIQTKPKRAATASEVRELLGGIPVIQSGGGEDIGEH